jgi:hypothetical protein
MSKRSRIRLLVLAGVLASGTLLMLMPGRWGDNRPLILLLFYKYAGVSKIHLDSHTEVELVTGGDRKAVQHGTTDERFEYGENKFRLLCPESKRWAGAGGFFSKNRNCSYEVALRCRGTRDADLRCKFDRRVQWGISWLLPCEANDEVHVDTKPCLGMPSEEDESEERTTEDPSRQNH